MFVGVWLYGGSLKFLPPWPNHEKSIAPPSGLRSMHSSSTFSGQHHSIVDVCASLVLGAHCRMPWQVGHLKLERRWQNWKQQCGFFTRLSVLSMTLIPPTDNLFTDYYLPHKNTANLRVSTMVLSSLLTGGGWFGLLPRGWIWPAYGDGGATEESGTNLICPTADGRRSHISQDGRDALWFCPSTSTSDVPTHAPEHQKIGCDLL